jgi:hypothetical protein
MSTAIRQLSKQVGELAEEVGRQAAAQRAAHVLPAAHAAALACLGDRPLDCNLLPTAGPLAGAFRALCAALPAGDVDLADPSLSPMVAALRHEVGAFLALHWEGPGEWQRTSTDLATNQARDRGTDPPAWAAALSPVGAVHEGMVLLLQAAAALRDFRRFGRAQDVGQRQGHGPYVGAAGLRRRFALGEADLQGLVLRGELTGAAVARLEVVAQVDRAVQGYREADAATGDRELVGAFLTSVGEPQEGQGERAGAADTSGQGRDEQALRTPPVQDSETGGGGEVGDGNMPGRSHVMGPPGQDSCGEAGG